MVYHTDISNFVKRNIAKITLVYQLFSILEAQYSWNPANNIEEMKYSCI